MLKPVASSQFRRDVRRLQKRGKDFDKFEVLLDLLLDGAELPISFRDHALKGDWKGWRDAHIEPDWVLIYKVNGHELLLARTGTHADLFGK